MKKFFTRIAALVAVVGLWSCSDDAPEVNPGDVDAQGDFYAKITLQLPTAGGSRSETVDPDEGNDPAQSNDGYEEGKDYENNVRSMTVVLTSKDATTGKYKYITSGTGTAVKVPNQKQPTFVMQFDSAALQDYAAPEDADNETDDAKAARAVYIFALCNPSDEVRDEIAKLNEGADFEALWSTILSTNSNENLWIADKEKQQFFMTNAEIRSHVITMSWNDLVRNCSSRENAYDLSQSATKPNTSNPVKVERVACRFDFENTKINETLGLNVYPVYDNTTDTPNEDGTKNPYAYIEMQEIALFNEATDFYLFRHTSDDGLWGTGNNSTLCGIELPTNYVVSPNFQAYLNYANSINDDNLQPALPGTITSKMLYPMSNVVADGDWTKLTALNEDDTHGNNQNPGWNWKDTDYKIWRYATENTIPGTKQLQGVTTGVAFKAQIKAVDNATSGLAKNIADAMNASKPIYAYRQYDDRFSGKANLTMIFGSAEDMYNYVYSHAGDQRDDFVKAVLNGVFSVTLGDKVINAESVTNVNEADKLAALANLLIPAEKPSSVEVTLTDNATDNSTLKEYNLFCYTAGEGGNYYCYYYYFNRHNNNGNPSAMGPMEFATVRNNIYKLKVDNVLTLGLPQDTPPDPWTPDETPEVYFRVSVKVLDWVVRKNNIVFN